MDNANIIRLEDDCEAYEFQVDRSIGRVLVSEYRDGELAGRSTMKRRAAANFKKHLRKNGFREAL